MSAEPLSGRAFGREDGYRPSPVLTAKPHPTKALHVVDPAEPSPFKAEPSLAQAREMIATVGASQLDAWETAMIAAKLASAEVGGADGVQSNPRVLQLAHQAEAVIRRMVLEMDLIRNGKQP